MNSTASPSPSDTLDSAPRRKPVRLIGSLIWWALVFLFAVHYYQRYDATARAHSRYGSDLYKISRIGVNVPDHGDVLKNVLAVASRMVGIGYQEGDFFKDGWNGYDFNGLNFAACLLHRSGGKQAIYPDEKPKDLDSFQKWSRALGEKYSERGDLMAVANGAYIYPPINAVLLVPWAGRGPNGLVPLWIHTTRVLVVALWILCIWAAWRAYGRTDPLDWLVVAAMIAFNYPIVWGVVECSNASIVMACLTTAGLLLLIKPWDWQAGIVLSLLILWTYAAHSNADTALTLLAAIGVVAVMGPALFLLLRGRPIPAALLFLFALAAALHAVFHYRAIPNLISMAILFALLGVGLAMVFNQWYGMSCAAFGLALAFVLVTRGGTGVFQSLFLAAFAVGILYLTMRTQDWMFGLVFALAIQLKLSPVIFLPWLLMRRRLRPLAATVVFSVVWLLIALYGVGLDDHLRFVKAIIRWVGEGSTFFPNQSFNGLIWRWMDPEKSVYALTTEEAPQHIARMAKMAGIAVIGLTYVALWFLGRRRATAHRIGLEYSLLLMAGIAASPTSWEHHYTGLLVVWVLLYAALRHHLTGWRRWVGLVLFFAGWTLNARFFPFWEFPKSIKAFADSWGIEFLATHAGEIGRVLVSYQFFSLLFAAILILMAHAPTPSERKAERLARETSFEDWDSTRRPA